MAFPVSFRRTAAWLRSSMGRDPNGSGRLSMSCTSDANPGWAGVTRGRPNTARSRYIVLPIAVILPQFVEPSCRTHSMRVRIRSAGHIVTNKSVPIPDKCRPESGQGLRRHARWSSVTRTTAAKGCRSSNRAGEGSGPVVRGRFGGLEALALAPGPDAEGGRVEGEVE